MPDGFGTRWTRKNTLYYMPDGLRTRSIYMPDGLGTRKNTLFYMPDGLTTRMRTKNGFHPNRPKPAESICRMASGTNMMASRLDFSGHVKTGCFETPIFYMPCVSRQFIGGFHVKTRYSICGFGIRKNTSSICRMASGHVKTRHSICRMASGHVKTRYSICRMA